MKNDNNTVNPLDIPLSIPDDATEIYLAHAQIRAAERYGLALSLDDLKELSRRTRDGDVGIILRGGGEAIMAEATVKGVLIRFVYSVVTHMIITILPPRTKEQISQEIANTQRRFEQQKNVQFAVYKKGVLQTKSRSRRKNFMKGTQ